MVDTVTIDLRHVARGLNIPLRQVQALVELLDEGNTVPFIARYRKDHTGGLDEEQVRRVQARLAKQRLLADRKQTILRSIESQGKLTDELSKHILSAGTTKRLEDLYLPYKPRKQTLATLARSRGLEPLAREILDADPACADLDSRAADFVSTDRGVPTAAEALLGAGHILAEQFSERADLRQRLREILQRTGKIGSTRIGGEQKAAAPVDKPAEEARDPTAEPPAENNAEDSSSASPEPPDEEKEVSISAPAAEPEPPAPSSEEPKEPTPEPAVNKTEDQNPEPAAEGPPSTPATEEAKAIEKPTPAPAKPAVKQAKAKQKMSPRELRKKKAEEKKIKAFQDYFDYREEIKKIPPHRVLAINRGERAKVLRVKVESDLQAMTDVLDELIVPAAHPHGDYLRGCGRDAMTRLILPALEREVRRELTDRAETHAVSVFARNLRNLLLQPPVPDRRVLAVDPGFKSGCKLAALDQFGNMLDRGVIYLVGKSPRRNQAQQKVVEMINRYQLSVVVIGNGTACRETEDFFAKLIEQGELKDRDVSYVIVNEAGASVYSASRIGREEFPHYDASLRGAISIGRRLQDPLSELVKIDPASIGVGLYQHDVKAKHLRTSLDEVVESCVNYVGVDVNTASPALLRYVSGLNQLTARRLYEHRRGHGPFRNREQLREVPGLGEATFVQAAGFLKIKSGDNPLDATWIHPESYEVAGDVLGRLQCTRADLTDKEKTATLAEQIGQIDSEEMAKELDVGTLLLNDILAQLARPGRDPRDDLPAPIFKQGVLKMEDLSPGMELTGTVLNVVDFGCFVDIGLHDSGLVHVSQLADKFIRDSHEVVAVGDIVKVWVMGVDKERRRVSLTMIKPGSERQRGPRRGEKSSGEESGGEKPRAKKADGGGRGQRRSKGRDARPGGSKRPPKRGGPPKPKQYRPKPRPKPVIPITDEMRSGKEPMRTFGDLLQFYDKSDDTAASEDDKSGEEKADKEET